MASIVENRGPIRIAWVDSTAAVGLCRPTRGGVRNARASRDPEAPGREDRHARSPRAGSATVTWWSVPTERACGEPARRAPHAERPRLRVPARRPSHERRSRRIPSRGSRSCLPCRQCGRRGRVSSGPRNTRECCRGRIQDVEKFRVGRIAVGEEVEAQPTRNPQRQVRGVPTHGIADVGERPPHVPVEVAGPDGPVPGDERLERLLGGGYGLEKVVGRHFHAHPAVQRTSRVVVTGMGLAKLSRTGDVSWTY